MSGVVYVLQLGTGFVAVAFALLVTLRVTRLLVRRRRAALEDVVARPFIDAVRVDAAIQGLRSASSEDLSRAVEAEDAARGQRTSFILDVDPLAGLGGTASPGAVARRSPGSG